MCCVLMWVRAEPQWTLADGGRSQADCHRTTRPFPPPPPPPQSSPRPPPILPSNIIHLHAIFGAAVMLQAFGQEMAWASHLSVPAIMVPTPSFACFNYAAHLNRFMTASSFLHVRYPGRALVLVWE